MRHTGRALVGLTLAAIVLGWAASPARASATYYVSRSSGTDECDGLSAARSGKHGPWQTLERASSATYAAGDLLLLKCGDAWTGGLTLRGDGTADSPITVSSYGKGPRPSIRGAGTGGAACIVLDRCAGWHIGGLELSFAQNAVRIAVDSRVRRDYDYFLLDDCYFHDIENPSFPDPAKREGSQHTDLRNMGWVVYVDGYGCPEPVKVRHLAIKHNVAAWCQGFYLHVMGPVGAEDLDFDANTLTHNSYNAIYHAGGKRFSITNSVLVYGYPWAAHPNGATQVLAGGLEGSASERNIVRNNEFGWGGDSPGCPDGCAYDFEGATNGVAFENNVIHDTSGEPVLFMGGCRHTDLRFDRNVFRDCVRFSARWDAYVTMTNSNTGNGTVSNNRFFVQPGKRAFIDKPASFTFSNNDEHATGEFVAMPLVTHIAVGKHDRAYTLACRKPGADIRYTTDGSLPMPDSTQYTGPVKVARSCALNVRAFRAGMEPSYVNSLVVDLGDSEGRRPIGASKAARSACDTFTIAFWVAPDAARESLPEANTGVAGQTGQQFAIGPGVPIDASRAGVGVSVGTNGVSVLEAAAGYQPCMLTDDCPVAGWHHVAIVYRQKQPALYVDGVYEKAGCKSTKVVHPAIGPARAAGYRGKVRDVRVYDRVLTDAEIQVLASSH